MAPKEVKMESAVDAADFFEVSDQNEVMDRIDGLAEDILPVPVHIHEKLKTLAGGVGPWKTDGYPPKPIPVNQEKVREFVGNSFNLLVPIQRVRDLNGKSVCCKANR
jgi:hypothetical protein